MQFLINCRMRVVVLSSLTLFLLLLSYSNWQWVYAVCLWEKSTIEITDVSTYSTLNKNLNRVPAIIHQTWRDADTIPLSWQQASNSCRSLHPDYEYRLWSDKDGRRLIEKEFPCLLATFDSYPYDIQRADVIRLIVLYVYGGIYLDLDIICLKSLDQLRLSYSFVLPKTMPVGLSNDFIISEPKHPFLLQVLTDLPQFHRTYFTKYFTILFSAGPIFLTREASYYSNRSFINILSPELYGKYVYNASRSLFRHLKASSWHGNDAALIKWIYRRRTAFLLCSSTLLLVTFALICSVRHRQTIRRLLQNILSTVQCQSKRQSLKGDKIYQPFFQQTVS